MGCERLGMPVRKVRKIPQKCFASKINIAKINTFVA